MRCCLPFVLLLTCFGSSVFCQAPATDNPHERLYVQIENLDRNEWVELTLAGVDIAGRRGSTVFAHISAPWLERLRSRGLIVRVLPEPRDHLLGLAAGYHSHAELTAELQAIEAGFPGICKLVNIGNSAQGRALWFMKISDNVNVEEDEPEFKYISSMHGDEVVGMELSLNLIQLLTSSYGSDPQITNLVNELEIWIMPLMNPDGYTMGSRYNAQGVDLNRDFPDRVSDPVNTTAGRAVETRHVMNWAFEHSTALSANFHAGALVANYPYDSDPNPWASYSATPEDALFRDLALTYSMLNSDMYNSPWFNHGIVNGVEWYLIYGGMEDWNYVWQGCNEITIELSDSKWPPFAQIAGLWNDNRASMLAYMEAALTGVRGLVTDRVSGQPVQATVRVVGIDHAVFTDPDVGDYQRLLLAGNYDLRFSADGYQTRTMTGITVGSGNAARVEVTLQPLGYTDLGAGLAGTAGLIPQLAGGGPLTPGSPNQVDLSYALPGATTHLVIGVALLNTPVKGGLLVPDPWVILSGLPVDALGRLSVPFSAPAGASPGTRFYLQYWIQDPGGPAGFSASNGLEAEIQ